MAGGDPVNGPIAALAADYIAQRRHLGYRSVTAERALRAFAHHLDDTGHDVPIPVETSLAWATRTASTDPCHPARRLNTIRGFLRHLSTIDGATAVPAPGLLGPAGHRRPPHIYSDSEIHHLMDAARGLEPAGGLRPHAYRTLFALLSCTGLRITEALALSCDDVDLAAGIITVRAGKRGRMRLVPLHPSAIGPLHDYTTDRQRRFGWPGPDAAFFRTDRSDRISYNAAHYAFAAVRRQLGWSGDGRTGDPTIHDLRHSMAVRRVEAWHAAGDNVDAKIPLLATYLGHVEVRDTYWYLSATPELMAIISDKFESFAAPPAGAR